MLSDTAHNRRRRDMIELEASVTAAQYISIITVGILILARRMSNLTRRQKTILWTSSLLSAGILVHLFATQGFTGFALVVMFVLGVIFAEIRHL